MASAVNAAFCALVATAFFMAFGFAVGRHILPRPLALGAAPVVGWAMFSAATLPVLTLVGFSAPPSPPWPRFFSSSAAVRC